MGKTDNQQKENNQRPKKPKKPGNLNEYAKYSGLAFQMIAAILIGLWIGMKIDERMGNNTPIFTAISTLLFIFASLYLIIKSLPEQ